MLLPESNKFLDSVISYVKFTLVRNKIRSELAAHIVDKIEYYIEMGYEGLEAEKLAVAHMGDAKLIGKELNRQHNPVIGWLWQITNLLVAVIVVWNLFFFGSLICITVFGNDPGDNIPESKIDYSINVNQTVQLDDTTIRFQKVILDTDGNLNIFYTYTNKWFHDGWTIGNIGEIKDNFGQKYWGGSGSQSAGFIHRCLATVENFNKSADSVIITYDQFNRYYKVEIPLKKEPDHEQQ